jgi:hypothetical protein
MNAAGVRASGFGIIAFNGPQGAGFFIGTAALATLDVLAAVVQSIDEELYQGLQDAAVARIGEQDADDWPAPACALLLGCPVWTEDADFFGTGVATWTTSRVKLYFSPDELPVAGPPEECDAALRDLP